MLKGTACAAAHPIGLLAVVALTCHLPAAASELLLYRSTMASGEVVYSDKPVAGAVRTRPLVTEPHPSDPAAAAQANLATERWRKDMLRRHEVRMQMLRQLDAAVTRASALLAAARAAREEQSAVGDGDRLGRRFSRQYLERQATALTAERRAERELEALSWRKAALQP